MADKPVTVTATVTPSGEAVAGDYVVSFKPPMAPRRRDRTPQIRFTVETSPLWALIGIGIIVADPGRPLLRLPDLRPAMSSGPRSTQASGRVGRARPHGPVRRAPRRRAESTTTARPDQDARPDQALRRPRRRRPPRPRGPRRRDLRPARPERRRQDDDDPDAARPHRADAGQARVVGLDPARGPLEVKRRVGYLPDSVGFYDGPDRPREPALHRPASTGSRGDEPRTTIDEVLDQVGLTSRADDPVETVLAGHAPAPRHRRRPGQGPGRPHPRRAHDRDRPARRRRDPRPAARRSSASGAWRSCCRATCSTRSSRSATGSGSSPPAS